MMKRVIIGMVILCQSFGLRGQVNDGLWNENNDVTDFKSDVWKASAIIAGSVALTFAIDKPINDWFQNNQSSFADGYTDLSNFFGEKYFIVPGLGASWGMGYLLKDERLKNASWNAMKSIVTTAIATELLKVSIGRARPFMSEGAYSFHPFDGADHYKSMPSGHTSLAFAAFTPFAETYSRWIYIVPASVAIARVYKNKHWLSDTVLGAGLGFLSGYIFTHYPSSKVRLSSNGIVVYF